MSYYWSFNKKEEVWRNNEDTIKVCIEEARKVADKKTHIVYISKLEKYEPEIDVDTILERLEEDAFWSCGEAAEGWLDGVDKQSKNNLNMALNMSLKSWLVAVNDMPTFGKLGEIWVYDLESGRRLIETKELKTLNQIEVVEIDQDGEELCYCLVENSKKNRKTLRELRCNNLQDITEGDYIDISSFAFVNLKADFLVRKEGFLRFKEEE